MASRTTSRSPRWYGIPARVLLLTFIGTLLFFAVSLLFALLGTIVVAKMHGVQPDLTIAYRHIALPIAVVAGSIIFVITLVTEVRRHRQVKALSALERMI